jgi:hypothetical protein
LVIFTVVVRTSGMTEWDGRLLAFAAVGDGPMWMAKACTRITTTTRTRKRPAAKARERKALREPLMVRPAGPAPGLRETCRCGRGRNARPGPV